MRGPRDRPPVQEARHIQSFVKDKPLIFEMSSTESVLQNARPERPGEFTFTWSIHNYSYCTLEGEKSLTSPKFEVEFLGYDEWSLQLFPRGNYVVSFDSFYLRHWQGSYEGPSFNFTLSIRKSNGQFEEGSETFFDTNSTLKGYSKFIRCVELMQSDRYLVNDTLTLRFRVWSTDVDIPKSVKWVAHSRIKVSKLDYTYIINDIPVTNQEFVNDFNKTIAIPKCSSEITKINLQVFKKECLCDGAIQFGIVVIEPRKTYFCIAVVHLIDANGKVAHSARGEYLFQNSKQVLEWTFPLISKDELYRNKLLYMPKNLLTLRCELGFAVDNDLETLRISNELDLESATIGPESDLQKVWIQNMHQCYKNKQFTDFIIRTSASQFPVSRTILSAHSEVFGAMFERDMKEGKTLVVDIEDLEDDTISKMLMYVYTSTFDVNDCSTARKLYYVADKYGITALQKMCSKYLMSCLDASNFCDILELADTHQDEELESCARDFFRIHAKEIISSENWRKLRERNSLLTSETVEWMITIS